MKYTPDKWKIIKLSPPDDETFYKVFGMWSGGYLDGDSWRMNSGIKSVYKDGEYFVVMGYSGSAYRCHKQTEGTNAYGAAVLSGLLERDGVELVADGATFLQELSDEDNA